MQGSTQHESRSLSSPDGPRGDRVVCRLVLFAVAALGLLSPANAGTPHSLFETFDISACTSTEDGTRNSAGRSAAPRCRHTLCEAIAQAERSGGTAVGAHLEQRFGTPVILVELAQAPEREPPSAFVIWSSNPAGARWVPSLQPCLRPLPVAQLQAQRSAIARAALCLLEAASLAECLADGEIQSVVPVLRHDQPFFLITIRDPSGLFRVCLLDPDTCDFRPAP